MATINEITVNQSAVVIGNAVELLNHIVMEVAGNDVSNSLSGVPITRDIVNSIIQQRFRTALLEANKYSTNQLATAFV